MEAAEDLVVSAVSVVIKMVCALIARFVLRKFESSTKPAKCWV